MIGYSFRVGPGDRLGRNHIDPRIDQGPLAGLLPQRQQPAAIDPRHAVRHLDRVWTDVPRGGLVSMLVKIEQVTHIARGK